METEKNYEIKTSSFFTSALTILFIGLKLTGYLEWSWVWVLSPLWITFAAGLLLMAIVLLVIEIKERL